MALVAGNLSREQALSLTERFLKVHFADADFAFAAGSTMRGTATPSSDIDLVVIHSSLPHAHRESQIFEGVPFEAFVHDEGSFRWFLEADVQAGLPTLIRMVAEGVVAGPRPQRAEALRREAKTLLDKGPPPLDRETLNRKRYVISSMLADLGDERPDFERVAIGAALYTALGDFILRSNGHWCGSGKWLLRQVTTFDATLGGAFAAAFDALFREGEAGPLLDFAEQVLAPYGGLLFDGYRADAPATWRQDKPDV
ncbi:nucleotidyltransferase domain-containing protein [Rhizobium terrae]|uniref:nucleotidyltransferase domain-containing protein n=1 Tax=Rhizobium terrae TaxID=2171756 RepID=UPI000E3D2CB9|nr:nucleotidyltransferase domain-containing protein [Rhizobium terrae]